MAEASRWIGRDLEGGCFSEPSAALPPLLRVPITLRLGITLSNQSIGNRLLCYGARRIQDLIKGNRDYDEHWRDESSKRAGPIRVAVHLSTAVELLGCVANLAFGSEGRWMMESFDGHDGRQSAGTRNLGSNSSPLRNCASVNLLCRLSDVKEGALSVVTVDYYDGNSSDVEVSDSGCSRLEESSTQCELRSCGSRAMNLGSALGRDSDDWTES
ncbi:hypothetical protein VTK56DRAFT_6606 [Thermocarpiscus australiensis]